MDAALGLLPHLTIKGTRHPTKVSGRGCFASISQESLSSRWRPFPLPSASHQDGTCIRDYIHVTDLVEAHVAAMSAVANPPALYNVGTGRGVSVREFVSACKKVTGVDIKVGVQRQQGCDERQQAAQPLSFLNGCARLASRGANCSHRTMRHLASCGAGGGASRGQAGRLRRGLGGPRQDQWGAGVACKIHECRARLGTCLGLAANTSTGLLAKLLRGRCPPPNRCISPHCLLHSNRTDATFTPVTTEGAWLSPGI